MVEDEAHYLSRLLQKLFVTDILSAVQSPLNSASILDEFGYYGIGFCATALKHASL